MFVTEQCDYSFTSAAATTIITTAIRQGQIAVGHTQHLFIVRRQPANTRVRPVEPRTAHSEREISQSCPDVKQ